MGQETTAFTPANIAAYILTGGKSRRMKGQDKLFLSYQGAAFHEHICRAFSSFSSVYLSVAAATDKKRYEALGLPMVADLVPGLGPMGGIYSGLSSCRENWLFVVACDMPLIDQKTVAQVMYSYQKTEGRQVMVTESGGRIQPLFGIYPRTVLPVMEEMIREGNYRMRDFVLRSGARVLSLGEDSPVKVNINTEEEYNILSI